MRPASEEQWQDAIDIADYLRRLETAEFLLRVELGRLFCLITGDFEVDIQACLDIIEDGRRQGIIPSISKTH
jgi:hypothetical protein